MCLAECVAEWMSGECNDKSNNLYIFLLAYIIRKNIRKDLHLSKSRQVKLYQTYEILTVKIVVM